ncbi:hypothetical protein DFH08DRAFT_855031 [Mycena albidolilacea]|uniref:Uncharacterized protein n=1 Tax=Mycena albidolilacea TaxID=1033008 RepID=A0AAD7ABV5_9AGAR|nr:hypothetical protein DFH08DRAFT_855031 [Mycena albidolilacea]
MLPPVPAFRARDFRQARMGHHDNSRRHELRRRQQNLRSPGISDRTPACAVRISGERCEFGEGYCGNVGEVPIRTHITYTCLLHLGGLPNLHGLHVRHFLDLHVKIRAVASSGRMFAALRELVFFSEAINSITSFLDAIESNALDKIELTFDTLDLVTQDWFVQPLADEPSSSLSTRSTSLPRTGLNPKLYLRERISFHDTPDALDRMLPVDWFHALLSCANLTEVVILTANGVDIDDAFLKRMATAWPQLRTLDLSPGCQSAGYAPRTMLAGLLPSAQHCPRLESLALVLDATRADPEILRDGISNCALARLDVVESPLSSPGAVAAFFAAIFPNLQVVSSRQEGNVISWHRGER